MDDGKIRTGLLRCCLHRAVRSGGTRRTRTAGRRHPKKLYWRGTHAGVPLSILRQPRLGFRVRVRVGYSIRPGVEQAGFVLEPAQRLLGLLYVPLKKYCSKTADIMYHAEILCPPLYMTGRTILRSACALRPEQTTPREVMVMRAYCRIAPLGVYCPQYRRKLWSFKS